VQSSLRNAKDIFKNGGHVTNKLKDQKVRVLFDNRRKIVDENLKGFDSSQCLLDSKALTNRNECLHFRFLSKFTNKKPYLKSVPSGGLLTKYKSSLEVGIRNFIKGYLAKEPCFGLTGTEFASYTDLIHFIYGFDQAKSVRLSRQSISQLKNRQIILRPVPKTLENLSFVNYLSKTIPHFNQASFLKF
jgi:hypothetical protein